MFGCYLLEFYLFLMRDKKGNGSGRKGKWEGTWRIRGKEKYNQDILYEKKIYFLIKEKLKKLRYIKYITE